MNAFRLFFLLLVACILMQVLLPWWAVVPVCALGGYLFGRTGGKAFFGGFFAVGVGWVVAALLLWLLTHSALPDRVAKLLGAPGGGGTVVALAGILSGLVGGVATLTGWWLRLAVGRDPRSASNAQAG